MANGANDAVGLLCPACRVNLVMSERQGIEIDYCPNCRGVWLDRGELDKIIERSASELAPPQVERPMSPPSPGYDPRRDHDRDRYDDRDRHEHYKKHKRKSFLEDLFD